MDVAMLGDSIKCNMCGAPMVPGSDGRTYACPYCGARVQVAIDSEQLAAGMRLDLANAETFLGQLSAMLTSGFAAHTRVEMQGARVISIEVTVEPDIFLAQHEARGVIAKHRRVVRGIALRTATVPLDRWVELLTSALAKVANQNASASGVLAQLTGRAR